MGSMKRERGVLKLVHPGRHIEIHREAIRAEEVMRKNPRHCITRPDFFKLPWIVVKPESILLPGNVFFIVPNHTIYYLLKSKGQINQSQPYSQQFSQYHENYSRDTEAQMLKKDVNLDFASNQQITMVKSCLSRPDSMRKLLNLKVSFNMSIQEEEQ